MPKSKSTAYIDCVDALERHHNRIRTIAALLNLAEGRSGPIEPETIYGAASLLEAEANMLRKWMMRLKSEVARLRK